MHRQMQLGMGIQSGMALWKLLSFVCGLLLLSTLGLVLVGQYVQASLQLCAIVAVRRGVWWLLTRQQRRRA